MASARGTYGTVGLQSDHHANEEVVLQKNEIRYFWVVVDVFFPVRCE